MSETDLFIPNSDQHCCKKIQKQNYEVLRIGLFENYSHKKSTMSLLFSENCAAVDLNWRYYNLTKIWKGLFATICWEIGWILNIHVVTVSQNIVSYSY